MLLRPGITLWSRAPDKAQASSLLESLFQVPLLQDPPLGFAWSPCLGLESQAPPLGPGLTQEPGPCPRPSSALPPRLRPSAGPGFPRLLPRSARGGARPLGSWAGPEWRALRRRRPDVRHRRLTSPQCRWPPLLPRLCSSAPWASEVVGGGAGVAQAEGAGIDGGPGSGLPRCQVRGAREAACGEGLAVVRWAAPSRARPSGRLAGSRPWRGAGDAGSAVAVEA